MVVAELRMSQSLVEKFLWVLGFYGFYGFWDFMVFMGFGVLWFLWVLWFYSATKRPVPVIAAVVVLDVRIVIDAERRIMRVIDEIWHLLVLLLDESA